MIKLVFNEHFVLIYCLDEYKTRQMCDKAVDSYLPVLRFNPDWFVAMTLTEKFDNTVFSIGHYQTVHHLNSPPSDHHSLPPTQNIFPPTPKKTLHLTPFYYKYGSAALM